MIFSAGAMIEVINVFAGSQKCELIKLERKHLRVLVRDLTCPMATLSSLACYIAGMKAN